MNVEYPIARWISVKEFEWRTRGGQRIFSARRTGLPVGRYALSVEGVAWIPGGDRRTTVEVGDHVVLHVGE